MTMGNNIPMTDKVFNQASQFFGNKALVDVVNKGDLTALKELMKLDPKHNVKVYSLNLENITTDNWREAYETGPEIRAYSKVWSKSDIFKSGKPASAFIKEKLASSVEEVLVVKLAIGSKKVFFYLANDKDVVPKAIKKRPPPTIYQIQRASALPVQKDGIYGMLWNVITPMEHTKCHADSLG